MFQFWRGSKNGSETMDEEIPTVVNIHCLDPDHGLLSSTIVCQLCDSRTDLDHWLVFDAVQFNSSVRMHNYDKSKSIPINKNMFFQNEGSNRGGKMSRAWVLEQYIGLLHIYLIFLIVPCTFDCLDGSAIQLVQFLFSFCKQYRHVFINYNESRVSCLQLIGYLSRIMQWHGR